MNKKEIHFYTYKDVEYNNYEDTYNALIKGVEIINTTQMCLLTFELQDLFDYDIYIHEGDDNFYRVGYGETQCERTNRTLKPRHNILKMWLAGEFDL